jgi:4-hydroxybenzoate polyprenyltransferase
LDRETSRLPLAAAVRALRPHQWVKNLLLLVPLVLAHRPPWAAADAAGDPLRQWLQVAGGFVAFCLTASAIYVINDLRDLAADRQHPTKRNRPFASGALPLAAGPGLILGLLAAAAVLSAALPWRFAAVLIVYAAASISYSLWLKQRMLVDVFVLAGLYTLRLEAGGRVGELVTSHWLLAFSIFLFVSLAFAKRYTELAGLVERGKSSAAGRNYTVDDLDIIESVGPASGYMAVLVLALYINDGVTGAARLYPVPRFLWLLCPLLMYWVTRVWFIARRRALADDPILFALKDRVSWYSLLAAGLMVLLASQPWRGH